MGYFTSVNLTVKVNYLFVWPKSVAVSLWKLPDDKNDTYSFELPLTPENFPIKKEWVIEMTQQHLQKKGENKLAEDLSRANSSDHLLFEIF